MPKYPAWIRAKQRDKWQRRRAAAKKYTDELLLLRKKYVDQEFSDDNLKTVTLNRINLAINAYDQVVSVYSWMLANLSGG